MNKLVLGAFVVVLVLVFGCAQDSRQQHMEEEMMEDMMGEEFEEEMEERMEEEMGEMMGEIEEPKATIKEFTITAKQWEFIPETITVNQGDTVKIIVTSIDVTHGFRLSEFGINEQLEPGKSVDIEFVADKKGTFTFSCSVPCGSGHGGMRGTLVVK